MFALASGLLLMFRFASASSGARGDARRGRMVAVIPQPAWRGRYVDRVTAGGASFVIPLGQRYQAAVSV